MYEIEYALRTVAAVEHSEGMPGSTTFRFTNGIESTVGGGVRSDERHFPKGTVVVCRLEKVSGKARKLLGMGRVAGVTNEGRPTGYDHYIDNRGFGAWTPPTNGTIIVDERE
ncbi:MAG: hypothetical protein BMS9Abin34_204 [Patescibacteria group bacterium]|nr:MAG: hypothetical protein BMS9Abin34_204 [Patescibacteria group bacterium]